LVFISPLVWFILPLIRSQNILTQLLLIFAVTLSSSWQPEVLGGEFGKQQPADESKSESEETEDAKGAELTDSDDGPTDSVLLDEFDFSFHTWAQHHHLETTFCRSSSHYCFGHCRAPPAASC